MKKLFVLVAAIAVTLLPTAARAQGFIIGGDGKPLGRVTPNRYDSESVCNRYGEYGNKYGENIFNTYGKYGGRYSDLGASNPRATKPPMMFHPDGQFFMYVTANPNIQPRIEPQHIQIVCEQQQ